MNIEIFHLLEGADQAGGLAVVIDVFRAFSLECYLFSRGVQKIYAVGREETAWELKHKHPEYLMAGERGGVILPGFDYGNSPSQTENVDFQGKILIHTTSAGTQGLVHTCAAGADEIITGSPEMRICSGQDLYCDPEEKRRSKRISYAVPGTVGAFLCAVDDCADRDD